MAKARKRAAPVVQQVDQVAFDLCRTLGIALSTGGLFAVKSTGNMRTVAEGRRLRLPAATERIGFPLRKRAAILIDVSFANGYDDFLAERNAAGHEVWAVH
ncbi:hypothetical protein SDC9_168380 [bioreactor metagenome]|uniref:Uncharacterized protein n=1 Tax=bioreactor metagenome TaxID=1076179 RepID=A0A645G2D7_9ZZZZ